MMAALAHPMAQTVCRQLDLQVDPLPPASEKNLVDCMEISLEVDEGLEETEMSVAELPTAQPDEDFAAAVKQRLTWQYPHQQLTQVPAKVSVTALVHDAKDPVLERPSFLYKEGLTAAERGTALHAFLQHADLAAAAKDPKGEAERQKKEKLLAPELYEKMDFGKLSRFFDSPLFSRMQKAEKVLREYEFITALPAERAAVDKEADYGDAQVLVQGVADVILEFEDHIELVDYKTDRGKNPEQFVQAYRPQLLLYAAAIRRRFTKPITRMSLYSFHLSEEIDVPFEKA